MSKKICKEKPNSQRVANEVVTHNVNNELLSTMLKAGKEERQKILENMILEDYSFWIYMTTNIPDDYFISGKNSGIKNDDGDKLLAQSSIDMNSQFKGKSNFNGTSGIKTKNKHANSIASYKKKPFPNTIEGLEKEFNELKGKTLSYHDKLRKKGLYSRIIKKKRKDERKKLKNGLKNSLAVDERGNKIKIKPAKRIVNNEGKVVSSKFDFTATESIKPTNKMSVPETIIKNDVDKMNKIITNCGKKGLHNDSNRSLNLELNGIKTEKKVKTINSPDSESTNFKDQNKLPFEPVFNKESKMVFSKFEFLENKKKKKKKEKDLTKILEKIKEKEANIKELEASGSTDKAREIKEKEKWVIALKKAGGEKVKDDPDLLKKSMRKEKHKKLHSKKKWEARIANVNKSKQEKQQKRSHNISARKTEKKKKKIKKAIKKGRYVPN